MYAPLKHLSKSNVLSGIAGGIIGGVFAGILVIFATPLILPVEKISIEQSLANTTPGMQIITNYQCPMGETKQVFINGVEDNFSLQNTEPARMHRRLASLAGLIKRDEESRDYDEAGADKFLMDYFEIPSNISEGLFITSLKLPANDNNDAMNIGDLLSYNVNDKLYGVYAHWKEFNELEDKTIWKNENNLYFAQLSAMVFKLDFEDNERKYTNLLDYIQAGKGQQIVDVVIGDDTIVDFTAITVCQPPRVNRGVTLVEHSGFGRDLDGISFLSCSSDVSQPKCDAIRGDTDCTQSRPLACFNDLNLPLPNSIEGDVRLSRSWTGGKVEFSKDVRGDVFQTIAEANEYCVSQFGPGWRVLSLHESSQYSSTAFTKTRKPGVRVWVDSKDENYPHTTCWARQ